MTAPRGLTEDEAALWERLAATVTPLRADTATQPEPVVADRVQNTIPSSPSVRAVTMPPVSKARVSQPAAKAGTLDGSWDRKLKTGALTPEVTIDLHGHGLDQAYDRLMGGLRQARGMGARIVLLVTGKPRPVDPADRGQRRGAIRAKVLDWLAASEHHSAIAAIRRAHVRHGGNGALYIVLKR